MSPLTDNPTTHKARHQTALGKVAIGETAPFEADMEEATSEAGAITTYKAVKGKVATTNRPVNHSTVFASGATSPAICSGTVHGQKMSRRGTGWSNLVLPSQSIRHHGCAQTQQLSHPSHDRHGINRITHPLLPSQQHPPWPDPPTNINSHPRRRSEQDEDYRPSLSKS
ncbi:unnamed protein product [Didymodactylos carnosus]|uniref:Uncharacterized protein n=1 Tax=Didymodactylos carnosus TaxID=1234261 RepID=A0A816BRU9_9BILA|nr:unnamed protein product [Didymodactylos carnosus]CAF1613050.1 unnamed protein product [Didymodactylos carnosus]CAF4215341.1 unnamed protein product [Didymodactylos carnosus]CAF4497531.1 unnamed protein product [Didymodactylos carnosus]